MLRDRDFKAKKQGRSFLKADPFVTFYMFLHIVSCFSISRQISECRSTSQSASQSQKEKGTLPLSLQSWKTVNTLEYEMRRLVRVVIRFVRLEDSFSSGCHD